MQNQRPYWRAKTQSAFAKFEESSRAPKVSFERVWQETWTLCRQGLFWPGRGMNEARASLSDFPITTYEDYRAVVERDIQGRHSSLTGRPIRFVTQSSATSSNKPKLMPVTDEFIEQYMEVLYVYWAVLMVQFPGFMQNKVLQTVSTSFQTRTPSELEIGLGSYLLYTFMPAHENVTFSYPYEVLRRGELFTEFGPYYALAQDVCAVHGLSPARILDLLKLLRDSFDRTLPYLQGAKALPSNLPVRHVSSERLALLKRTFGGGPLTMRGIWPSVDHLRVWKSSTGRLQLKLLEPYLDSGLSVIDHCYCSSEGAYTVPVPPELYGGAVNCGSIILEFIDMSQPIEPQNLVPPWQLQVGCQYEVFITNKLGYIRYRLGDVVSCNGFYHHLPVIEFQRRSGGDLTLGAGLAILTETQVIDAMAESELNKDRLWVLGRNEHGNGLIFYHVDDVDGLDFQLLEFSRRLEEKNLLYGRSIKGGTLITPKACKLPMNHKLWIRPSNSQVKPRVFTNLNTDEV